MDHQLFQLVVSLFGALFAIIGVGISWWVKSQQRTLDSHQQQFVELISQISQLNVELAKNYAPRAELQDTFNRIFEKLDEIQREVRHA